MCCKRSLENAFGSGTCSGASRLPGALSAAMLSNSRSWASGGRYGNSPSALHAVGCVTSNPASRTAARQSPQSVGPGVKAGGQNHGLPHTVFGSAGEEVVEKPCPYRHLLGRRFAV